MVTHQTQPCLPAVQTQPTDVTILLMLSMPVPVTPSEIEETTQDAVRDSWAHCEPDLSSVRFGVSRRTER